MDKKKDKKEKKKKEEKKEKKGKSKKKKGEEEEEAGEKVKRYVLVFDGSPHHDWVKLFQTVSPQFDDSSVPHVVQVISIKKEEEIGGSRQDKEIQGNYGIFLKNCLFSS